MPIDYSKYPPNWKTEIRPRILKRENYRCKFCGVIDRQYIFRGKLEGREVYQYASEIIFTYPEGEFVGNVQEDIEPINGDPNQKAIKIILTIAHLDHDEGNHKVKDDRLAALCQKCYLIYDAPEKKRRREAKKNQYSLFPKGDGNQ